MASYSKWYVCHLSHLLVVPMDAAASHAVVCAPLRDHMHVDQYCLRRRLPLHLYCPIARTKLSTVESELLLPALIGINPDTAAGDNHVFCIPAIIVVPYTPAARPHCEGERCT